ncbi:hypothetical protein E2I00_004059, partial [Balaenoptera physalus]
GLRLYLNCVAQGRPSPAMTSSLLLAFLFLAPDAVATPRADSQCLACGGPALDLESQRELLLNLAKRSILDKLHLSQRPTLSRPVSRAALRTALQRLHGSPQGALPEADRGQEYEIISFAETGLSNIDQTRLDFHFSSDRTVGGLEVQQASLMFFVQLPPNTTWTLKVRVLVLSPHATNLTFATQHLLEVDDSGWHQLLLGPEAQAACSQGHLILELVPEGQVAWSPVIPGGAAHRPFVTARVRVGGKHRVRRRGIDCQGRSRMCCRQEFFVDFREIGWHDWIIQPEGYAMNFCTGQCPLHVAGMPGIAASFHTAVLNLLKANTAAGTARGGSCCVPTARRPLSLLYYDRNSNIVKTDIPDMVVEAYITVTCYSPPMLQPSSTLCSSPTGLWAVSTGKATEDRWLYPWPRVGVALLSAAAVPSLASTQPDSTEGATAIRGSRPDPGPFTRNMGLSDVQLQLVLLWALVWAQRAGSVCPSCGGPTLAPQAERALVLELAKQQILEGLHLTGRPIITHPPPQAALTRALRRLQRGSVVPANGEQVISFAAITDSSTSTCSSTLTFYLSTPRSHHLYHARLWLHHQLTTPGWHALTLPSSGLRHEESGVLKLQLDCRPLEGNSTAAPQTQQLLDTEGEQRPFLELKTRPKEPGAGRARRRTPSCEPETPLCCRRDHYVDFQELGWRDWILQPEGYQLNYCSGQCPPHLAGSPGIAASFHSAVFSLLKANNPWPLGTSCCVPTARRPLSLLYLDRDGNVVKTDVPDMVVEACGCS